MLCRMLVPPSRIITVNVAAQVEVAVSPEGVLHDGSTVCAGICVLKRFADHSRHPEHPVNANLNAAGKGYKFAANDYTVESNLSNHSSRCRIGPPIRWHA